MSLLVSLLLNSCSDDENDTPATVFFGYDYLPLQIGQESTYSIDSVLYDEFTGRVDTARLQLKEMVKSSFKDAENREAFLVDIYRRENDTLPWNFVKVVAKTRTSVRYELLEDNLITVPLIFPVGENKSWDANRLNVEDEQTYNYESVHASFELNGERYDSTITIEQIDNENLIEKMFAEEKYALHFGLIYRKDINIETELNGNIRNGYEATVRLIEFKPE